MNAIFSIVYQRKPAIYYNSSWNFHELRDPNPDILGLLNQERNKNTEEEQSCDSV